jgi:IS605 OrfB family transposase
MKSIKIKLGYSNQSKEDSLLAVFTALDSVAKEYLLLRKAELESKTYMPFKEHYRSFRAFYPNLNSGVLQSHLRAVDSQIKAHISWCKKKHKLVSFPETIRSSIPLRNDMFRFEINKKTKTFDAWLIFLRKKYPLKLCDYHQKCLLAFDGISDSSIIRNQSGELVLRLVFKTKETAIPVSTGLGIDIGIAKPIVFSDGKMLGSGAYIKHKKLEFGKKRARSQKNKASISAKQGRWTNDLNHKLSRKAVDYAISQGVGVLALENLKGHHLSNRRFRKYSWAFKDLLSKVTYKAELAGLKVISVNPAYTSQRCSCCGSESKDNRKSQDWFLCGKCNYQANADVNASKNILHLSLQNGLNMNPTIGKESILETQPSLVAG